MKKRLIIILTVSFLCIWGCEEFLRRKVGGIAGSYPFVESWKIKAPETEVLEAIKTLKKENQSLQPPNEQKLIEGRYVYDWQMPQMVNYENQLKNNPSLPFPEHSDSNSTKMYWCYVDFYYSDTKEVVYTWTRPDVTDSSITTLALVGFNKLNDSLDYRLINRDFWFVSNKLQIRKFKQTILRPILDKIEERRKNTKHGT